MWHGSGAALLSHVRASEVEARDCLEPHVWLEAAAAHAHDRSPVPTEACENTDKHLRRPEPYKNQGLVAREPAEGELRRQVAVLQGESRESLDGAAETSQGAEALHVCQCFRGACVADDCIPKLKKSKHTKALQE